MREVERQRDREADEDRVRDDLVRRARAVHVLGEGAPRDGLRVERLDLLARPDVGALGVEEQLTLSADDRLHDDELEDGADDGAERLDEEGRARWELGVLSHLEVASEPETLTARVGAVPGHVQRVSERLVRGATGRPRR